MDEEVNTDDGTDEEEPKVNPKDGNRKSTRLQSKSSSKAVTQPSQPKVNPKKCNGVAKQTANNKKSVMEKSALQQIKQDRLDFVIILFIYCYLNKKTIIFF